MALPLIHVHDAMVTALIIVNLVLGASARGQTEVSLNSPSLIESVSPTVVFLVVATAALSTQVILKNRGNLGKVPKTAPWLSFISPVDFLYFLWKLRRDGIHLLHEYIAKHGSILSVSGGFFRTFVISDLPTVEKILSSADSQLLNKAGIVQKLGEIAGLSDSVVCIGGSVWHKRRKLLLPSFSLKSLEYYLNVMDENAMRTVNEAIHELEKSPKGEVDGRVLEEIQNANLMKTICSIVVRSDITTEDENVRFRKDFEMGQELCMYRIYNPWLLSSILWRFHPKKKLHDEWNERVDGYMQKLIDYIKTNNRDVNEKRSILEYLIDGGMTNQEINSEVRVLLAAGHETVSITVTMLLFHLALNPNEQNKCRQEVDELFKTKDSQELTLEDVKNLKYLDRCVLECLRLTPALPQVTRTIGKKLKVNDETELPAGSNVWISIWTVHRNPEIYPNPSKFDPDRFLPENSRGRNPYAYLPFSGGPRNCIGMKVGMMEVKVVVARILQEFEVFTEQKLEDVKFLIEMSLRPSEPIEMRFRRRAR